MTAKNIVVKGLQKALEAQNEIVLAWVFGSFASEKQRDMMFTSRRDKAFGQIKNQPMRKSK